MAEVDNLTTRNSNPIGQTLESSTSLFINTLISASNRDTILGRVDANISTPINIHNSHNHAGSHFNNSLLNHVAHRRDTSAASTLNPSNDINGLSNLVARPNPNTNNASNQALPQLPDELANQFEVWNSYFQNNQASIAEIIHDDIPVNIQADTDPANAITIVNKAEQLKNFSKRLDKFTAAMEELQHDNPATANQLLSQHAGFMMAHLTELRVLSTQATTTLNSWQNILPEKRSIAFHYYEGQLSPIYNTVHNDMTTLSLETLPPPNMTDDQASTYYNQGRRLENFVNNAMKLLELKAQDPSLTTSRVTDNPNFVGIFIPALTRQLGIVQSFLANHRDFYVDLEQRQLAKSSQFIQTTIASVQADKTFLDAHTSFPAGFTNMSTASASDINNYRNIFNRMENFLRVAGRDLDRLNKVDPMSDPYISAHHAEIDPLVEFITQYMATNQALIDQVKAEYDRRHQRVNGPFTL